MRFLPSTVVAFSVIARYVLGAAIESIADVERVATDRRVLHIGGRVINVGIIPAPASRLASVFNTTARTPIQEGSLTKRVTTNACLLGCSTTCTNDLSPLPVPPTSDDCAALSTALLQFAQTEVTNTFPCNIPFQVNCPNFVIAPGFEQAYWLGTCLVGLINLNPPGGASEAGCDFQLAGIIPGTYTNCVTNQGMTGGICLQTLQSNTFYGMEVRHV